MPDHPFFGTATGETASPNGHAPAPADEPLATDLGNSERFVAQHAADLRWVREFNHWLHFDGQRWAHGDAEAARRAKMTVRAIFTEAADAIDEKMAEALAKHALRSQGERPLAALVKLARTERAVEAAPGDLDRDPWLLNVQNGTLDLRTGALRPHRREDLLTKLAPVAYDPAARCPRWEAFLERIFDRDADLIAFVQRAVGYSMTGTVAEQCFFLMWGGGANGKSTLLNAVRAVLGPDYATVTRSETFMIKGADSIPCDVAALRGSRMALAVEAEDGRRLAEALVKQATGGDPMSARHMRAEFFTFVPMFKIWIATNHRPVIRGTDLAMWRRVRLVPFTVTIPPDEQDHGLEAKLRAEAPGILNWMLAGCTAWQRDGLRPPGEVTAAVETYRQDMDVLGLFLRECCVLEPGVVTPFKELWNAYTTWATEAGERPVTKRALHLALDERGLEITRAGNDKARRGLRLRWPGDAT